MLIVWAAAVHAHMYMYVEHIILKGGDSPLGPTYT